MPGVTQPAVQLVRETLSKWSRDNGWLYAAACAAFAALALAPMLLIALRVAEAFGDPHAVRLGLARLIDPIVGHGAVKALAGGSASRAAKLNRTVASAIAIGLAIASGARLFYALQRALHTFWETPLRTKATVVQTALSFVAAGALTCIAIALLAAGIIGSVVYTPAGHALSGGAPAPPVLVRAAIGGLAGLAAAPAIAALFRWLPGAGLAWADVWVGALATSAAFAVAQFVIVLYLASMNLPWTYGSAASLIVILLWLYYSAYCFLLGAEFTYVYGHRTLKKARAPAA